MKYDSRLPRYPHAAWVPPKDVDPDAVPFPYRCRVLDAEGQHIPFVERCDTQTGAVVRYAKDAGGRFLQDERHHVRTVLEMRPAPLTLEEIKPGESYLKINKV